MPNETALTVKPGLIDRVGEKVERGLGPALRRLPPRVSLLTGGVFILITLYLPLAVNSCGDVSGPGKDIALGEVDSYWPGMFGLALKQAGRWFYIFLLAWAALTLCLVLLSFRGRITLTSRGFAGVLFAMATGVSLWVLVDYFYPFIGGIPVMLRVSSDWAEGTLIFGLLLSVTSWALRSVKSDLVAVFPYLLASALLCSVVILTSAELAGLHMYRGDDVESILGFTIAGLYALGPIPAWLRFRFSRNPEKTAQWTKVRRRLAVASVPAVAGQILAAYTAIDIGVWGLIPCLVGIHLITLGYLQLAREAETARAGAAVPIPRPAIAGS